MKIELIDQPFKKKLFGKSGQVEENNYGAKGQELMGIMWSEIQERGIPNHGLNHWVYLPDECLFTGVELKDPGSDAGSLEGLDVVLTRFLRYVHVGPYSKLPEIWAELWKHIEEKGETKAYPNVEIYGHWSDDPNKLETTILIGLS